MKEVKCKLCGSIFVKSSNKDNSKKYCSKECSVKARFISIRRCKKNISDANQEIVSCKFCGQKFNFIEFPKYGYCSDYCKAQARRLKRKRIIRKCGCGKEFYQGETKGSTRIYCSEQCRKKFKNAKDYEKEKIRRGRNIDYSERVCLQCGEIFTPRKGSPQQKYCSRKCSYRAKDGYKGDRVVECKICKKIFVTNNDNKIYCSDECRNYKEPEQMEIRSCKKCKKIFIVGSKSSQAYCSAECRDTPLMYHHTCEICGKEFDNWQPIQFACSGKCKEIRDKRKARELRKDHGHVKHRFEKEKIIDKGITWKKIMLRDGCNCGICGLPVDINDYTHTENGAFIAGANYPSIDHIIPRAKGGVHSWDNVQLAHFYCNTIKCDKMEVTA